MAHLEHEFQPELNQARVCPRSRTGYDPEVSIVGGAANGVGWSELSPVENVEELRSKLEAEPVVGGELRSPE